MLFFNVLFPSVQRYAEDTFVKLACGSERLNLSTYALCERLIAANSIQQQKTEVIHRLEVL